MGFNCGIVGLPNVGKSHAVQRADRDRGGAGGELSVLHHRAECRPRRGARPAADTLAAIGKSAKIVPTSLEFVDIAGLVRGASKGEGLGNQFLANIREVDAIIHVLRCFEDPDVTHVEGTIDPIRDADGRDRADAGRSRQPGETADHGAEDAPAAATRRRSRRSR